MNVCPKAVHDALKESGEWPALPRLRKLGGVTTDEHGVRWEWKNCPTCDSTLVRRIEEPVPCAA